MTYYFAYGFRIVAFYLCLPLGGWLLATEDVGKFFYYLTLINLISTAATLGLGSFIIRSAYSARKTEYEFGLSCGLSILFYLASAPILALSQPAWLWLLLPCTVRTFATFNEARLVALGDRYLLTRLYFAGGFSFIVAGALGVVSLKNFVGLLIGTVVGDLVLLSAIALPPRIRQLTWLIKRLERQVFVRLLCRRLGRALAYGLPILLSGLFGMILSTGGRLIIERFGTYTDVALFSMMFTLAFASNRFIGQPTNLLLTRQYMSERGSSDYALIRRRSGLAAVVTTAYALACYHMGNVMLRLVGPEYEVDPVNFLLVGASALPALLFSVTTMHWKRQARTAVIALWVGVMAGVSVALSLVLVPTMGILGVSIATCVSYCLLFIIGWVSSPEPLLSPSVVAACFASILIELGFAW